MTNRLKYILSGAAAGAVNGLTAAALAAWLSFSVDTELLRRPFGVYLLAAGIYILLQKPTKP